jgi:hypothetical protein
MRIRWKKKSCKSLAKGLANGKPDAWAQHDFTVCRTTLARGRNAGRDAQQIVQRAQGDSTCHTMCTHMPVTAWVAP